MKHGGHHSNTGPMEHHSEAILQKPKGGKDPHAEGKHHSKNKVHGMADGTSPKGGYKMNGGRGEEGGEGMSGNIEYC